MKLSIIDSIEDLSKKIDNLEIAIEHLRSCIDYLPVRHPLVKVLEKVCKNLNKERDRTFVELTDIKIKALDNDTEEVYNGDGKKVRVKRVGKGKDLNWRYE